VSASKIKEEKDEKIYTKKRELHKDLFAKISSSFIREKWYHISINSIVAQ